MSIRVILADDQIPWNIDSKDEIVKKEILAQIGEKLIKMGKDPEQCYEDDKEWFQELVNYLETKFELTYVREFEEAERLFVKPEEFDVAVVDLSWTGDSTRKENPRENIGLKLLETLAKSNPVMPVIAFSQNFEKDRELMSSVLEHGALPLQKYYDGTGHQALASAIKYVSFKNITGQKKELDPGKVKIIEVLRGLTFSQGWKVAATVFAIFSFVAVASYNAGEKNLLGLEDQPLNKQMQPMQKTRG